MNTFEDIDALVRKDEVINKRKVAKAILSAKVAKDFEFVRVLKHGSDPGAYANQQEIALCYKGQPFATWNREGGTKVLVDFTNVEADDRISGTDYNKIVDMLRRYIPELWFVRVVMYDHGTRSNVGTWKVAQPTDVTDGGPRWTNVRVLPDGKAYLSVKRDYDYTTGKWAVVEVTVEGVVSRNWFGYGTWSSRRTENQAFQRIRNNERRKVRKVEGIYEGTVALWWWALGQGSWDEAARLKREAKLAEAERTARDRWIQHNGLVTYMLDGERVVDLYKATVKGTRPDGTESRYLSQHYSTERIEYLPGTRPYDPHFSPHNGCGGGLHLCAKASHTSRYVRFAAEIVVCPVRVDDIILIGLHSYDGYNVAHIDKVKVQRIFGPIKERE